jgi:glycosyltransferase involved in cell wall biosynthesis
MAARRFAERHRLPLVSFFQDWWPDIAEVHGFARRRLEREFLELAEDSTVAICISEGMKRALGGRNRVVLPPIPADNQATSSGNTTERVRGKFRVLYFGNLGDYGPMLGEALKSLEGNEYVELVVRGARPKWSADFAAEMKRQGRWLEFAPRAELQAWLESADAFLVPMEFDPAMRRRMETSFPSKLIEFAQFRKPLVVWGPEYCSAIEWAKQGCSALCVTERAPEHLAEILMRLALSQENRTRLAVSSFAAAQQDFDHKMLQESFLSILRAVAEDRVDSTA